MKPPIQETGISGNVREKEAISRVIALVKGTPRISRDTSLAPGANSVRSTTSRRYSYYSQFVTGNLSLISEVTGITALNFELRDSATVSRLPNRSSCISCDKKYFMWMADCPYICYDNNLIFSHKT